MSASRFYRTLLRLYPRDYRSAFEAEMCAAFEQSAEENRAYGRLAYAGFLACELAALAGSAAREWLVKATTSPSIRGRSLPDVRNMRPVGVPRELWFASPRQSVPNEIAEAEKRVESCLRKMEHAIANHDFPGARFYSDEDLKARDHLRRLRAKHGLGQ